MPKNQNWTPLCLKISAQGAYRVYEEFDENSIAKNQDGSFTVTASLPDGKWLIRYLLSFSADIEVLSPQTIRDRVKNESIKIIHQYSI